MKTKVSVIIPAYNIDGYIERCVKSVIRQDYDNLEIIIVDDGSTDDTPIICDRLTKEHSNVCVIHQKNQGLSEARNNGIKMSSGKFISLIDGDDEVEAGFISSLMRRIAKDGSDIAISGYKTVDESGELLEATSIANTVMSGSDATIELLTKQSDLFVIAWNKIYRKTLFIDNDIRYPKDRIHEDNLTTYKLLSKAKKVSVASNCGYKYYKRNGSITSAKRTDIQVKEKINAALDAMEYLKDADLHAAAIYSLFLARIIDLNNAIKDDKPVTKVREKISAVLAVDLNGNKFVGTKAKVYLAMLRSFSGKSYIAFRKIADALRT